MDFDHNPGKSADCQDLICIPLYILSKEYIKMYTECLKKINLTFTQFLVMIVLWHMKEMKVKEIGNCLFLDSGTLTPVLKKLEHKGFVLRKRSETDARDLCISLTDSGEQLKEEVKAVREIMKQEFAMSPEKEQRIHALLGQLLCLLAEEFEEKSGKRSLESLMEFIKTEDRI